MRVGVLALQGGFAEHCAFLRAAGCEEVVEVRLPAQLATCDALVIPGGESTTIAKLAAEYGLADAIRAFAAAGHALWGSCAGAILLSRATRSGDSATVRVQPLGLMAIEVDRNAFGSQIASFEAQLACPAVLSASAAEQQQQQQQPFNAVFIRAPVLHVLDADAVEVLAALPDGRVVAARQGALLATSFHPELTHPPDTRFHQFFLRMAAEQQQQRH